MKFANDFKNTKWLDKMATVILWLKDKLIIIWYIFVYLLVESLTVSSVLILSIAICHWSTKIILLITRYKLGDVGQTYLIITTIGLLAVQVPKSWRLSLSPVSLQDFQEKTHPFLFSVIRISLVILALSFFVASQFYTYHFKYDSKKDPKTDGKGLYDNDVFFLLSLSFTAFIFSRILLFHREFNRLACQKQIGPVPLKKPHWFIYFFYYFSVLFMELLFTAPLFVGMSALSLLCDFLLHMDYVTYFLPAVVGFGLGHLLGVIEELYFPVDRYYQRFEPYFTTIHWDSRLNVLVFTLVPFFSRWYYFQEDNPDGDMRQNYNFFCGCMATTLLAFSKYHTLFSYVAAKAVRAEALTSAPPRPPPTNRVHPQCLNDVVQVQQPRRDIPPCSNVTRRSKLYYYFAINGSGSTAPGCAERDQTSVSTGTCTSLLNRANNNATQIQVQGTGSLTNSLASSLKTCPRSPEPVHCDNQDGDMNGNICPVFVVNKVEVVLNKTPEMLDKENCNLPYSKSDDSQSILQEEKTQYVKLKRCPSNALPVLFENENE